MATKKSTDQKQLKVTLRRSLSGRLQSHRACVAGLGLRRLHHSVTVLDTPENRGMINKVSFMLDVEEA
jgi:large subunit ribosomal protein L30